jgi:formate hydrogenlyase subunit 3/multisubunit Na+/H+ antiporter MnhD subunit
MIGSHPVLLSTLLGTIALWLIVGIAGLARLRQLVFVARVLFPAGALIGMGVSAVGVLALFSTPESAVLPVGLPQLPFHLRLDALAGFFLILLGSANAGISIFAAGYFREGEGTPPGLLCLQYHVFLASMAMVVVADDAYAFMVAWEVMALSSFFLVTTNHRIPEIRRAGFLYLLIAHLGALAILLCFGVLQANTGDYTFANMRAQHLTPFWGWTGFLLALVGFGAKAGIVPLHVWLPEAHPAAPSPVSALMSGVMLKMAVYGLLRVTFDLLQTPSADWGLVALSVGLLTALYGVIFSTVQTDMKRLLAYSSIENLGLVWVGIGVTILFRAHAMPMFAALALTATLYHCLNHAFFKSLLFLGTGAVLHATGERNLGRLGGLMRPMPWVGGFALVGALAAAGLPPLNGFVSEWLLLQSFLFTTGLPSSFVNMLIPVLAAGVALTAALGGYAMVKFFGVIFLGQPRERALADAHDAGMWERLGLAWLSIGCLALGLFPLGVITLLDPITRLLVGEGLAPAAAAHGWLLLAPIAPERASYNPVVLLGGIAASVLFAFGLVRWLYHGRIRRAPPWDCGTPGLTARMQDTAEGFGQPIRHIFGPVLLVQRELPGPSDEAPRYRVTVDDRLWYWLYLPVARVVESASRWVGQLQRGRIAVYLLYSFVTLLVMLWLVQR